VIDNPDQVERLLSRLTASLPITAIIMPQLAAVFRARSPGLDVPRRCRVVWADYMGDEGGIVCQLDLGAGTGAEAHIVSITHLLIDPSEPLAREVAAYQKHRIKRLRRFGAPAGSAQRHFGR